MLKFNETISRLNFHSSNVHIEFEPFWNLLVIMKSAFHSFPTSTSVPTEKSTILKENFNRWYSVKSYYFSGLIIDLPISIISVLLFSVIIYIIVGWPMEACEYKLSTFTKILRDLSVGMKSQVENGK